LLSLRAFNLSLFSFIQRGCCWAGVCQAAPARTPAARPVADSVVLAVQPQGASELDGGLSFSSQSGQPPLSFHLPVEAPPVDGLVLVELPASGLATDLLYRPASEELGRPSSQPGLSYPGVRSTLELVAHALCRAVAAARYSDDLQRLLVSALSRVASTSSVPVFPQQVRGIPAPAYFVAGIGLCSWG
jgi:hypothetical protein